MPPETWPALVEKSGFEAMRREALENDMFALTFEGGANRFFFKGANGRWRDVLTADELREHDQAVRRALTPDCAAWV